jgi:hypothetical protein
MTKSGVPCILCVCEGISKPNSPVTLLSENQIREHNLVIDSVSKEHCTGNGTYGTQTLYANDHVEVPFSFKNGLMTFDFQYPTPEDIETYEIIQITGS